MRLRFVLPALFVGAGLLFTAPTPAQAKTKTNYKVKKFKAKKYKHDKRFKNQKVAKHKVAKHR